MKRNFNPVLAKLKKSVDGVRGNLLPTSLGLGILISVYQLTAKLPPSVWSYTAAFPALLIIFITAIARLNEITPKDKGFHWEIRKVGLSLTGATAFLFLFGPVVAVPRYPTWMGVSLFWGMALSWLATPGQPPWWNLITGLGKEGKPLK